MTEILSYDSFRRLLNQTLVGSYVFFGEEDYLKRDAIERARKILIPDKALEPFCHLIAEEGDVEKVRNELSFPPMMGASRLIELYGLEPDKMKEAEFSELCEVLSENRDSLLIVYVSPGKLGAYTKKEKDKDSEDEEKVKDKRPRKIRLAEFCTLVDFAKQDARKLGRWISSHISANGLLEKGDVSQYIIDFCGTDMFILKGEISKLCAYVKARGKSEVTRDDVAYVCSSYTEIGAFDFANAILSKNRLEAFKCLADIKAKKDPVQMTLSSVIKVCAELISTKTMVEASVPFDEMKKFLKIEKDYPMKLRINSVSRVSMQSLCSLMERCHEVDIKLKSTTLDGYVLLENLILTI